jgi:hypothetical protein
LIEHEEFWHSYPGLFGHFSFFFVMRYSLQQLFSFFCRFYDELSWLCVYDGIRIWMKKKNFCYIFVINEETVLVLAILVELFFYSFYVSSSLLLVCGCRVVWLLCGAVLGIWG